MPVTPFFADSPQTKPSQPPPPLPTHSISTDPNPVIVIDGPPVQCTPTKHIGDLKSSNTPYYVVSRDPY